MTRRDADRPEHRFQLIWPYTDLLLHDMGEGLADHRPVGGASGREWRTPPLWGIGLTGTVSGHMYLLHDGRARGPPRSGALARWGSARLARRGSRDGAPGASRAPSLPRVAVMGAVLRASAGLLAIAVAFVAAPAAGQTGPVYARAVERTIERFIVPGYAALSAASEEVVESMAGLCAAPGEVTLSGARASFARVVAAFSRMELFRFGPARENHRFERLFFWPDRRGRGRRQVEALLAREDPGSLDVSKLREKSVAVQGLPALEYVLHGKGREGLGNGDARFRCLQGEAIAGAIDHTARRIHQGWTGPRGFDTVMRTAGPENPVYRTRGEVVEDLLGAAAEQLGIVEELKLGRVLRDGPDTAKPKRAPFWRSGLTLASIRDNVDGVLDLLDEGDFEALLPETEAHLADRTGSELRRARDVLAGLSGGDLPGLLSDPETHRRISGAASRIGAAASLLREDFPRVLGLAAGFNSLDGD